MQNQQLDPDAINLAKAIRQSESGGDFNAKGKSGEVGAYQFTPDTWNASSMKYLGQHIPIDKSTKEQQNEVAYKQIKEWKDQGKNVGQIASMWNAGASEPDAYTGKFSNGQTSKGTNKHGANFDVPAYAKSVATAYQTIKNGGQPMQDINNPSASISTQQSQPIEQSIGNKIMGGINNFIKPWEDVAAMPMQGLIAGANKLGISKALLGKDIQDPYSQQGMPNIGGGTNKLSDVTSGSGWLGKAKSGLTVGTETAAAYGAGGLLGSLRGATPLMAKEIGYNIPMDMDKFATLGKIEKLNVLGNALKTAEAGDATVIVKAMKYLDPVKSAGVLQSLLSKGLSAAKYMALTKILGDTVGGLLHTATGK